jgi:hypothetical protein
MGSLSFINERDNVISLMNEVIEKVCHAQNFKLEDDAVIEVNEEMNVVNNFFDCIEFILSDTEGYSSGEQAFITIGEGAVINYLNFILYVDEKYTPIQEYIESGKENEIYPSEY